MNIKLVPVIGALIGGILGVAAWAGIASATNQLAGYMALAVGVLAGLGAMLLRGRGLATGMVCAAIALVAIFGGRMAAVRETLPTKARQDFAADPKSALLSQSDGDLLVKEQVAEYGTGEIASRAAKDIGAGDAIFAILGLVAAFAISSRAFSKPKITKFVYTQAVAYVEEPEHSEPARAEQESTR